MLTVKEVHDYLVTVPYLTITEYTPTRLVVRDQYDIDHVFRQSGDEVIDQHGVTYESPEVWVAMFPYEFE